jgi:hypothetical protein
MKNYMIEREIPNIGTLKVEQLLQAAAKSNQVLDQLGPEMQWQESFLATDKMFCVYLAEDEAIIRKCAALTGFARITESDNTIDPITAA